MFNYYVQKDTLKVVSVPSEECLPEEKFVLCSPPPSVFHIPVVSADFTIVWKEDVETVKQVESKKLLIERDKAMNEYSWRVQRWESEKRQGLVPTDDIVLLDLWIQEWRDLTKQSGYPYTTVAPTKPF